MSKRVSKLFFQNKSHLVLFVVIFCLIIFRFVNLSISPNGLNHDEAEVLLNAKYGLPFPLGLISTNTEGGISAFPSMLLYYYFKVFPVDLFWSRFIFTLVNISTGVVLSILVLKLSKIKLVAIITFLVFLINPWSFVYSRALTEAPFAILFFLLGALILFSTKGRKIYYSLLPFLAAFFSYQGTKIILPFIFLIFLILHYKFIKSTKPVNYLVIFFIFSIVVGIYFLAFFTYQDSTLLSRSPEFIFMNIDRYSSEVNLSRGQAIDMPFNNLFINKFTFMLREFASKYVGVYSPSLLFFTGDPRSTYAFGEHGLLYLADFVFVVAGIVALVKTKSKLLGYFILTLAVFAPIVSGISLVENSYIFRSALMMPVFVILISLGIYFVYTSLPKKSSIFFAMLVIFVYAFLFFNFLHMFFVSFPVKQQENQFFSERVLVSYMNRISERGFKVVAHVNSPLQIRNQYDFFNNNKTDNVDYSEECNVDVSSTYIIQSGFKCSSSAEAIQIVNQKDSGSLFSIYNDKLCDSKNLQPYIRFHYFGDYNVESLSDEEFCARLISKYEK